MMKFIFKNSLWYSVGRAKKAQFQIQLEMRRKAWRIARSAP